MEWKLHQALLRRNWLCQACINDNPGECARFAESRVMRVHQTFEGASVRALGIALQKNFMRYAVLTGNPESPRLVDKGRQSTSDPENVPALMDWYETHFQDLISVHVPEVIAYKLVLDPRLEQQHDLSFPMGILNLLAQKHGIEIREFSQRAITPARLSLGKTTDLMALVDKTFGEHPPYWDKHQKEAVLVAWFCL
jgi:hypothetical protein